MTRVVLSMIGGIVIPILYYIVSVFISFIISISIGWERLPRITEKLLFIPIGWTEEVYNKLFTPHMFDTFSIEFLSITIIGNFILYFLVTYTLLNYFQDRFFPKYDLSIRKN